MKNDKDKKPKLTIEEQLLNIFDPDPDRMGIEEALRLGREQPLPRERGIRLAKKCILALRRGCERRGDKKGLKSLEGDLDELAARIVDGNEKKRKKS